MSKELLKRIITSFLLIIILSISLFINKFVWAMLLTIASIISFYEFNNLIKKKIKKENNIIIFFYLISGLYFIFFIYTGYDLYKHPPIVLIFIILICIFSDIGGFVIGNLIGGKKLTKISPSKTISGSIGSFLFSLSPIIIYTLIYKYTGNTEFYFNNYSQLILVSLFLSFVCQFGDLYISFFKRMANVKDTGSLLPGHGGLLDRIDGMIFVLPAAFIIKKLFF